MRPVSAKRRRLAPALSAWRELVLLRAVRCQFPGCTNDGVEAHHIIPRSVRPDLIVDPANGMAVCRACHRFIDANPLTAREFGCHGFSHDSLDELATLRRTRQ